MSAPLPTPAGPPPLGWAALCAAARELAPRVGSAVFEGAAEGDRGPADEVLVAVHVCEQAQLLLEASAQAVAGNPAAGWLGPEAFGPDWVGLEPYAAWRARALEELELARRDGAAVPVELLACSLWSPDHWGVASGTALARASHGLDPGPEARAALGRARVAGGEAEALAALEEAREDPGVGLLPHPADFRARVELARAAALERRGDLAGTLAALASVGRSGFARGGPAFVHLPPALRHAVHARLEAVTLALALLLGDREVAQAALERLEPAGLEPPDDLAARLRGRVLAWRARTGRSAVSPVPERAAPLLFRALWSRDALLGRVAFALLA